MLTHSELPSMDQMSAATINSLDAATAAYAAQVPTYKSPN